MSDTWITVLPTQSISEGTYQAVFIEDASLLIGCSQGDYFAIENVCTHDGGELEGGPIEGKEIICPRHGAGFCIKTGEVTREPAYEGVKTFPVRIQGKNIQVQLS